MCLSLLQTEQQTFVSVFFSSSWYPEFRSPLIQLFVFVSSEAWSK